MRSDSWLWIGLGGVALLLYARRGTAAPAPAGVPSMPWTFRGLGFDPNYVPEPERWIALNNQTKQPSFQGGTRTPSVIATQVLESDVGNVYAGVPFMY